MSEIAVSFLIANLAAGAAILAVLALRKPLRAMFGASLAYTLWALVPLAAVASLLPPRIDSIVLPAPVVAPEPRLPVITAPEVDSAMLTAAPPVMDTIATPAPETTRVIAPEPVVAASASPAPMAPLDPWGIAVLVWFAGVIAALVWQLRNQSLFMADARAGFAGPAVAGFLRQRIVTPSDFEERFETTERQMILAHETIHINRGDARVNALVALARCVCWFNPAIHIAAHMQRIDQELACDAAVTERHPRARAAYASALLKAQMASRPLPLGCYWPAKDKHPLMERIEMLKQARPSRGMRIAGAGAIAMLAIGAGLSAWAAKPADVRTVFEAAPVDLKSSVPEVLASVQDAPAPAPVDQKAPLTNMPLAVDEADPIYLRGHVEKIEFSKTSYVAYVRAESVAATPGETPKADKHLWQLSPVNFWGGRDYENAVRSDILNKFVNVRGERFTDKTCDTVCRMQVREFIKCPEGRGFAPGFVPGCQNASLPGDTLQEALQKIQFDRQQVAPQQGAAPSALDPYDPADPIYLRGKVERIDFADRSYTVFVRATSISESESGATRPETRLWQLSPTPYWGDKDSRDSANADLANATVAVRGFNAKDKSCRPECRMLTRAILVPKARALPTLATKSSFGVVDVTKTYDTGRRYFIEGKVQRIEFSDRMFDAYIQTEAKGTMPASLFQVRSEYRQPRADIEKYLLNKTVKVAGWPALSNVRGLNLDMWSSYANCSASCAMYGTDFVLPDNLRLMPAGEILLTDPVPAPAAFDPDGPPVVQPVDPGVDWTRSADTLFLTGRVISAEAYGQMINLTVEEISRKPQAFTGAKPGTIWKVGVRPSALLDVAPERQAPVAAAEALAWVGKVATFQREAIVYKGSAGMSSKNCETDCYMSSGVPLVFD